MKLKVNSSFTSLSLFVGLVVQIASAFPSDGTVTVARRRTTSILNSTFNVLMPFLVFSDQASIADPAAQPNLPTAPQAQAAAAAASLNLDDIQGDILWVYCMPIVN